MKRKSLLSTILALVLLITGLSFTMGNTGCKEISKQAQELAVRALVAFSASPQQIDKLPISPEQKRIAKRAVTAAGKAYEAYKDGKGTWGAFLAAFSEVESLIPVDGWFGKFASAIRKLLSIPDSASLVGDSAPSPPDLNRLREEDVRQLEELVGIKK